MWGDVYKGQRRFDFRLLFVLAGRAQRAEFIFHGRAPTVQMLYSTALSYTRG